MDSDSEPKLISLLSRLLSAHQMDEYSLECESLVGQVISLVKSMDLESQPKPESELMSLVNQTISFFNSMDFEREPLRELISYSTQLINSINWDSEQKQYSEFMSVYNVVRYSGQEPELMSLIHEILYLVIPKNLKWGKLISLSPQVQLIFENGKFCVEKELVPRGDIADKLDCLPRNWIKFTSKGEEATHFLCQDCYGNFHEEHEKAPVEIIHSLHPKHPLRLAIIWWVRRTRECYCCVEDLKEIFYYCSVCDFAMNIACVEKQPEKTINYPKWHEHTLALFPRLNSLTCNVCALADSRFLLYICHQSCDFFVHRRCINLPRVIRISRHLHRISFIPSFDQGDDWSCGVCRTKIDNDYGGYSCIKESCSYVVHSRCATQKNVWDGVELEGVPEEIEVELEPYVTISPGIIQHFSHLNHHLKLDENTDRDYDDHKQCQACIMPIYSGNFYSCLQCDFILHEDCAKLSRNIHYPIHPHLLTLVGKYDGVLDCFKDSCSACDLVCTSGFFYKCSEDGCKFKLDVKCATTSEPLDHGSHMHPLFLTSKPGENTRSCSVCEKEPYWCPETFNCIEGTCEFSLCFKCATISQKVRYKHDKHMLTLSYGEETSVETYWCELCETRLKPKERFYKCDVYPCVTTLHVKCLIGENFYVKPGSSWLLGNEKVTVLPNNQRMSRPICSHCNRRCPQNKVFECSGLIFCSLFCTIWSSKQ